MTGPADPETLLAALREASVLVVGDVMLDRFVYGAVERISPEGPIPVLRVSSERRMLGGAGNVLRNLRGLGARARLVAAIGDDEAGREVAALAAEGGEDSQGGNFPVASDRPTTVKTRYVAAGQQLLRADTESRAALSEAEVEALRAAALAALPGARALILSDYGKGVLTAALTADLIAAARRAGLPVAVDPQGRDYRRYRGASLVTPNRRELSEATGLSVANDGEVEAACRVLIADRGIGAVLATLGDEGMTLVAGHGAALRLPAETREVFDVSGAGDTVAAVVAAGLAGGLGLAEAARVANLAAGIVVGKLGTAPVEAADLTEALWPARAPRVSGGARGDHVPDAEAKVLSRDATGAQAAAWRRAGLRVGFTNGCFDLLHPGHLHLLRQARAACDRLIVGLNSDASARRLKGTGRPVQNETARALVLASLNVVDRVTIFEEDTPLALIEAVRPDLLVKGADYRKDQVVGGALVESHGGEILLAELAAGHSTTATVRKLDERARRRDPA